MKINEYVEEYSVNISDFARKCGVSRGTILRILDGKPMSLEVALKIEKGTKGAVKITDLGHKAL